MNPDFLSGNSLEVAPMLLGWILCRQLREGTVKLKIVETEAYHQDDPASHSFKHKTARTAPMFEGAGTIYVYFTYGMHYCLNLVCGPKGRGEAILLRAGESMDGIKIMQKNRNIQDVKNLANGPAKLTQSLGIKSTQLSGKKLGKNTLWLEPPENFVKKSEIVITSRIGIKEAVKAEARFYLKNNPFVSKL